MSYGLFSGACNDDKSWVIGCYAMGRGPIETTFGYAHGSGNTTEVGYYKSGGGCNDSVDLMAGPVCRSWDPVSRNIAGRDGSYNTKKMRNY